jgi:hypothetical protein
MEKDNYITDVMFRADKAGDFKGVVFAILPHEIATLDGSVTFYTHFGQHGSADYHYSILKSRPATEQEYSDLKREMEGLGYDFKIVRRRDQTKLLKEWDEIKKARS